MLAKINLVVVVSVIVIALLSCTTEAKPAGNENPAVMCRLPAVRGHCRALLPRWRYDPSTGKCSEFKFGGCDGNGNNFMSHKACMAVCGGV